MTMSPAEYRAYQKNKEAENKKPSKYKNKKVEVDGKKFDSKKEAQYYATAKLKVAKGLIRKFEMQVRYKLEVNGQLICVYVADFVEHYKDGRTVVIDVKSDFTRKLTPYRIKKKLMRAIHGIDIQEV